MRIKSSHRFLYFTVITLFSVLMLGNTTIEIKPKAGAHRLVKAPQPNDGISLYGKLNLEQKGLDFDVFLRALNGYKKLLASGELKKSILAIADLSQPSGNKRLYIIDMENGLLLRHTLVAHGQGSGNILATNFSNTAQSHQSSLGFYVTDATYFGGNGLSLRLRGMEKGFNDNAMSRAIVMHGASYVNKAAASSGRIGRSWGCPAVSIEEHKDIISLLKNGSCLFLFGDDNRYLTQTNFGVEAAASNEMN